MTLPERQTGSGSGIMPLNSPGGSTVQCSMQPGLLCLLPLIVIDLVIAAVV